MDVSDPSLTELNALLEVKQEVAPWVDLQLVDVHCDEIDDEQSRFVETVVTLVLEAPAGR